MIGLALTVCLGCSDGRVAVTGQVTFDGVPLESGGIVFVPYEKFEPEYSGKIIDGTYNVRVPAEKMNVRIYAMREEKLTSRTSTMDMPSRGGGVQSVMYIPDQYNTKTTLTAEITTKNKTFDFNLEN